MRLLNIILFVLLFSSCKELLTGRKNCIFIAPNGESVEFLLAQTNLEKKNGLSGVKLDQIGNKRGMLFLFKEYGPRSFWMPNTYFDLDIYFLDSNLEIIDAELNVKHHPGMEEPPKIEKTRTIFAKHVIELPSKFWKKFEKGNKFKLNSKCDVTF